MAHAPKNIVVCSDGTGNSANKDRGTNVFRLYEALDLIGHLADPALAEQIAFYDDGVGTETFKPMRVLGGAFGLGLSRNVRELYASLVRSYNPDDRIFLFGFSRGAFTVRTLGGFIASCGILDRAQYATDGDLQRAVDDAYGLYRSRYMTGLNKALRRTFRRKSQERPAPEAERFGARQARFRARHAPHAARIRFIGVWDTVDAVGLPFDHLADFINFFVYPFKFGDRSLSGLVDHGRHAMAIDDERHTFHPVMWNETPEDAERVRQVWFAGVHSNVGGGYPKQGMSLVSLDWMMEEARAAGLRFNGADRAYVREHVNVNDKLYNSRAGRAVYYRYKPRDIGRICEAAGTGPKIHESAIERVRQQTEGYAPGNLPGGMSAVATGSAPTRYPAAAATIADAYAGAGSLLERVRAQVFLRRISHYAFILLSLALAALLIVPQILAEKTLWAVVKAMFWLDGNSLIAGFMLNPWLAGSLLAAIFLFFLIQLGAEKAMRRSFSGFWHQIVPRL